MQILNKICKKKGGKDPNLIMLSKEVISSSVASSDEVQYPNKTKQKEN